MGARELTRGEKVLRLHERGDTKAGRARDTDELGAARLERACVTGIARD